MEEEDFLKRGLIFGLLLAIFNFTLLRHYGHGLEDIYGLTGVAAVVGEVGIAAQAAGLPAPLAALQRFAAVAVVHRAHLMCA